MVHPYSEKIDVKKEIRDRILRIDKLEKEERERISTNFNKTFDRAERIVKDGEVKKYFFSHYTSPSISSNKSTKFPSQ